MTATTTDTVEHLDFEGALPCESMKEPCDQPATWIGRSGCPKCGRQPFLAASQLGCDYHYEHRTVNVWMACQCCGHLTLIQRFWKFERL